MDRVLCTAEGENNNEGEGTLAYLCLVWLGDRALVMLLGVS